jgi:hypothetical protein
MFPYDKDGFAAMLGQHQRHLALEPCPLIGSQTIADTLELVVVLRAVDSKSFVKQQHFRYHCEHAKRRGAVEPGPLYGLAKPALLAASQASAPPCHDIVSPSHILTAPVAVVVITRPSQ